MAATGEETLKRECEDSAFVLGTGAFEVSVLTGELEKEEATGQDLQRQIEEAHVSSVSSMVSTAASGVLSLFGAGEVAQHTSAEKIQKLRQWKAAVDARVLHLTAKIARFKAEQERAMLKLDETLTEGGSPDKSSFERIKMKQAVLDLARKVDPDGAQCVVTLGKLMLRTPRFLQDKNLLGSSTPLQSLELEEEEEVEETLDLVFHDASKMFEVIDKKTDEAVFQSKEAVDYLLDVFKTETLPQVWREHIIQLVCVKGTAALDRDFTAMFVTGHKCAVTANWPRSEAAENREAYATILPLFQVPEQAALPAEVRTRKSSTGVRSKDHLTRLLDSVDAAYLEATSKDPLVFATPRVLAALLVVVRFGMCQLKEQEMVLYGHPDCKLQEPHWFVRRKAACKICEFAACGNLLACDLISKKLLDPSEHWMVREVVAAELCSVLGHMTQGGEAFAELLEHLTEVVLTVPHIDPSKIRSREMELRDRKQQNVQSITEQSLIKELHRYHHEKKLHILRALKRKVELTHTPAIQSVFDRILAGIGGMPKEVETPQLHIPTMKWQRERQRELDERLRKA